MARGRSLQRMDTRRQCVLVSHPNHVAGGSLLSEVLQMTYFTDYVSFYVALLNGADPTPVTSIDYLKDRLAKA